MNLEFDELRVNHLLSYNSEQVIQLGPASFGLWFLRGKNEVEPALEANDCGKSSLFKALCWCIYGRTVENLRGPDLKPWGGGGTPTASLHLLIDDEPHIISRTAVTNGLKINGKEVGPDAAAELIGLSFEVFTNTILLAQGQPLFFDRSPKDKMQLFTDVLKLERWETYSTAASDKVKALTLLKAELEGELTGLEGARAQTLELLEGASKSSAAWEIERKEALKERGVSLVELEADFLLAKSKQDDANLAYDSAETEIKALRAVLVKLNKAVTHTTIQLREAEHEQLEATTQAARLTVETLNIKSTCAACGQLLTREHQKKHTQKLKSQLALIKVECSRVAEVVADDTEAAIKATHALDKATEALVTFEKKSEIALTTLHRLQPRVAELETQLKGIQDRQKQIEEERNPHNEHVRSLRQRVAQIEEQTQDLAADVGKASRQIERNRFWVTGFKDVKLYLIQGVLDELQLVTNSMLSEIGLEGWQVGYSVEKESKSGSVQRGINVTIIPAYGYKEKATAVKWEAWGGGVGQRLRLAGALALSEVLLNQAGVSPNLEILDEPTRGLSDQGVEDLCVYLKERAQRLERNVWLVDHMAHETAKFAGGALVTKTDKGSVIHGY